MSGDDRGSTTQQQLLTDHVGGALGRAPIETCERLVEQIDGALGDQRACKRHAPLLTARKS